jgi:hypothetical protein
MHEDDLKKLLTMGAMTLLGHAGKTNPTDAEVLDATRAARTSYEFARGMASQVMKSGVRRLPSDGPMGPRRF